MIFNSEEKMKGAGMRRIYFFAVLLLQLIAYPIAVFNVGEYNDLVYYAIVLSCFISAVVFICKDAHSFLQIGALYFTCIADFFLILGWGELVTGVSFFFVAQLFYAARTLLLSESKKERVLNLSIRTALCIIFAVGVRVLLGEKTQPLFVVAALYYVNLLVNIAFAFLHFKGNELLCIGLVLFALCDTALGLKEATKLFSVSKDSLFYQIFRSPYALEAAFYCPSQVLLAYSASKVHKK